MPSTTRMPWYPSSCRGRKSAALPTGTKNSGLKITHFPAIHTRKGSISFKVEFTPPGLNVPPITMIYSGDTRPNTDYAGAGQGR